MFCDYCTTAGVSADKTNFIKGCTSLRLEMLKYHEASKTHVHATITYINKVKPSDAPAVKAKLSLNKSFLPKIQKLFRTVHAINVKARPNSDYIWLSELDKAKGLELGEKYHTSYACTEFASAIDNVSRANTKDYLLSCNFISVVVDGSKDSLITENEMVYTHTGHKGVVKTTFIKCGQVQCRTAQGSTIE